MKKTMIAATALLLFAGCTQNFYADKPITGQIHNEGTGGVLPVILLSDFPCFFKRNALDFGKAFRIVFKNFKGFFSETFNNFSGG